MKFNPDIIKETKKDKPLFIEEEDWFQDHLNYHHEPKLTDDSCELVDQALEVRQDNCESLDNSSESDYLKTYGLGPCIFLIASNSNEQKLGAIHFDACSDIPALVGQLKEKLGVENFNEFKISLMGGIKEMEGSEDAKKDLDKYLKEQDIKVNYDHSMSLAVSDYKGYIPEESAPMLCYQNLIVDKKTGRILSFQPIRKK